GIEVPVPIFNTGAAARSRAEAEYLRTSHTLNALLAESSSQLRTARAVVAEARARVEYYRDVIVPRRRRIVELTTIEHNAMVVGVFQLLQAKQNEAQARRNFIDAQLDYWAARNNLDRALNGIAVDTTFKPATDQLSGKRASTTSPEAGHSMFSRRKFFLSSAGGALGGLLLGKRVEARTATHQHLPPARRASGGRTPVITPNGTSLPFRMENGVKVFHLTAEPVKREFLDPAPGGAGFTVNCWGYNGTSPGPTIEAFEGDRVRIYVTNKLPEGTSIHWHGSILPNRMHGRNGLTPPRRAPGERF